jgi:nitroreductase
MMNTLRKTTICLAPLLAFLLFHSFIIAAEENRSDQACLFNIIKNRRTVRRFKSTPVPKEHILKILDAARFAPTAGNQQPWKFLVIQDRAKLELLKKDALLWYLDEYKKTRKPTKEELSKSRGALKKILEDVLSAPVYVAVLVDSKAKYSNYILYDGTLAALIFSGREDEEIFQYTGAVQTYLFYSCRCS